MGKYLRIGQEIKIKILKRTGYSESTFSIGGIYDARVVDFFTFEKGYSPGNVNIEARPNPNDSFLSFVWQDCMTTWELYEGEDKVIPPKQVEEKEFTKLLDKELLIVLVQKYSVDEIVTLRKEGII